MHTSPTQQNGIFVRTHQDAKRDIKVNGFTGLQYLSVCNGEMVAAVSEKLIIHRSISSSLPSGDVTLPSLQSSDAIEYLHLSPTGFHVLVSTKLGENYYISTKTNVAHHVKKIKGIISAVGWNPDNLKEVDTGHILLGTTTGSILETEIAASGTVSFVKEMTSSFGGEKDLQVSAIHLIVLNDDEPKAVRMGLIVCVPGRLSFMLATINTIPPPKGNYMSTASLHATFVTFPETPQHFFHPFFSARESSQSYLKMPSASTTRMERISRLVFFPNRGNPKRFLWVDSDGLIFGRVNSSAERTRDLLEEEKHMDHRRIEGRVECPSGTTLTEFHALLAYSNRLVAISLLTYQVMYEDLWTTDIGQSIGLTMDPSSDVHWLWTPSYILKYKSNDEARYVWREYLERGEYANALSVANQRVKVDPEAYQLVLKRQAEKFISEKNFIAAAEILAQSTDSFETVVLKFLSTEEDRRVGLKTLLDKKLEKLVKHEDRMRRDAIVMWLLEVQLAELAETRREEDKRERNQELNDQLRNFLIRKNVQDSIMANTDAVYRLMVSHADFNNQLFLALHIKDYETAIGIFLLRHQYKEALEILKNQNAAEAWYKYGPQLVEFLPKELWACLIRNPKVSPRGMLPTLCVCQNSEPQASHAVKYLEWAITQQMYTSNSSLHNMLITLYAQYKNGRGRLHEYFVSCGMDRHNVPYDIEFAIRTCEHHDLTRSTIYLYCVSEMFSEAVDIALKKDVVLAKDCAHLMDPEEDVFSMGLEPKYSLKQRKNIWLKIAKHVISLEGGAEQCIELLDESKGVLTIQDVFPYFPEFTRIEHLKEALCVCLQQHSQSIQEIEQSLKEATQTAQEIREKTERLKNRVTVVKSSDGCAGCQRGLGGRPFYPFTCRHFFHRECLEKAIQPTLNLEEKKELKDLQSREQRLLQQVNAEHKINNERESRLAEIEGSIDRLLGAECPLCGNIAIELIDKPFFSEVDYLNDRDSWVI